MGSYQHSIYKDDVSQDRVGNVREVRDNVDTSSKAKKVKLTYKVAVLEQNATIEKITNEGQRG